MRLQDKGTSPLHVAAAVNQPLQVELLLVYGADPGAYDQNGRTPGDVARSVHPKTLTFGNVDQSCLYTLWL